MKSYQIVLLPGDGIGPEVTSEAVRAIETVAARHNFAVSFDEHAFGGASIDSHGKPVTDETLSVCEQADAVLLGAVGGPAWDELPAASRPEAGLLSLRKHLGVFANIRPVTVSEELATQSPLQSDLVRDVDLVVVRELTGGIYFGTPSGRTDDEDVEALSTMRYKTSEIERIARTAFRYAQGRRGTVTSVDKSNVLAVSQLWREVVSRVHTNEFPDIELTHMYVDNAAMQLVRNPSQYDVILTGNLFGDILSDLAAVLPGSIGLLPSASIGGSVGLFEPVHGSAPEIAGKNIANPVAAILSGAMLLDYLGETQAAAEVRSAVAATFRDGYRTADLATDGKTTTGTNAFGQRVIAALSTQEAPVPVSIG